MNNRNLHPLKLHRVGILLGNIMWLALPNRRKLVVNSLQKQMGYTAPKSHRLGRQSVVHSGRSFAELLLTRFVDHRFIHNRMTSNDFQLFKRIMATNRPIVATTGHFGAWELLSNILCLSCEHKRALIVVRHPKNSLLTALLAYYRSHHNVDVVHKDQAVPAVLRCLKDNGLAAFLVDHNTGRSKAFFMPFLSRVAAINFGPALLALRAKALVWPIFLMRTAPGRFHLHVHRPLDTLLLTGRTEEKLKAIASYYTLAVEDAVYRCPEQWFWMHKRWKTRPKGRPIVDPRQHFPEDAVI